MEEQDVFLKQKGAPSKVDETPVAPQATFSWYTGEPKRFGQLVRKPDLLKALEAKMLNRRYTRFPMVVDVG